MANNPSRVIGAQAEALAVKFLQTQGLQILTTNYYHRFGEIDIIARSAKIIIFVEVKSRLQQRFGSALESVTVSKIKRLVKTARHFLQTHKLMHCTYSRFDIITFQHQVNLSHLLWIKNAFQFESYL